MEEGDDPQIGQIGQIFRAKERIFRSGNLLNLPNLRIIHLQSYVICR
jgi:hypothetical protein